MKLQIKLLLSFTAFCFLLPLQNLEGQTKKTKKLKRPTGRVGITSVDSFVGESFDLYDKVYMYDSYAESGKALEDDDYELLIDAIEDVERVTTLAPNAVADLDGAGVLKQGKGTLQINRAKKALNYSLKTSKKLLTQKRNNDDNQTDQTASTSEDDDNTSSDNSNGSTSNDSNSASTKLPEPKKDIKVYSKFDFVPGDKILLYDDFSLDYIGDFPAKWDTNGSGELVTINDEKWFRLANRSTYIPLVNSNLPENYTIEFDMLMTGLDQKTSSQAFVVFLFADNNSFKKASTWSMVEISPCQFISSRGVVEKQVNGERQFRNEMGKDYREIINGTTRISIAANKSRLRVWLNENKIVDVPRLLGEGITNFKIYTRGLRDSREMDEVFIKDFKIAETGVDLRSQLINEGIYSTNGILFDSGSANIQPQSYGIIRQISQALLQVKDMKLNIIGHTDSDGDDEANLALSKKRAAAVKNALITIYNVSGDRLQTDGKGESVPVGDNKTTDGKAQNRRVEFIKL